MSRGMWVQNATTNDGLGGVFQTIRVKEAPQKREYQWKTVFVRMGCPLFYLAIIRSANRCALSAGRCSSPRPLYVD